MKLNVMFTIAAIVLILFGLLSFFAPPTLAGFDPTAAFSVKINGVILLALGVLAWLVRNDGPSKTRDSVVLGYTLLFALWMCVSIYGIFLVDMPSHNISWIPALIQVLITVGFFMAGKASMSASTS
jgi:hypothetical protein